MSYYRVCPYCHCNLDPGERCDCRQSKEAKEHTFPLIKKTETDKKNGTGAQETAPGSHGLKARTSW